MSQESQSIILEWVKDKRITPEQGLALLKSGHPSIPSTVYLEEVWTGAECDSSMGNVNGSLLLFDQDEQLYDILKNRVAELFLVKPGRRFKKSKRGVFELRPGHAEDYRKLLEVLHEQESLPSQIVHHWFRPEQNMKEQLEIGIYALLPLCQAMLEQKLSHTCKWVLLHPHNTPLAGAVSGFAKSLMQENANHRMKTVERFGETASSLHTADMILRELNNWEPSVVEVRYQEGVRQVKRVREKDMTPSSEQPTPLRQNGVYLITGGAGGLGLLFAEDFAKRFQAKLVLIGRSELSAEKQKRLKSLEAHGAEVLYVRADVSNHEDLEQAVQAAKKRFGNLHGVLHAAGVNRDAFLLKKTVAELDEVLAPKVMGTQFLHEATAGESLDFFALFSSVASVLGNAGQCDYAYANAYLDRFAAWRAQGSFPGRTLTLNWPLWEAGGMQMSEAERDAAFAATGLLSLQAEIGLHAFETALASEGTQVIVAYGDREKIVRRFVQAAEVDQTEDTNVTNGSTVDPQVLQEQTERYLKQVFEDIFKLPASRLDLETGFEEYGIDSVRIQQFNVKMEQELGALSKTLLYEYTTLGELKNYMVEFQADRLITRLGLVDSAKVPKKNILEHIAAETIAEKTAYGTPQEEDISQQEAWPVLTSWKGKRAQRVTRSEEGIAIIGLAGRYPQAGDLDEFWENIQAGKDCITEIPEDRFDARLFYDEDQEKSGEGKMYSKWGGFLEDAYQFDPLFFAISPKEAETMDPQERLFLQTAWAVLEDAGYTRKQLQKHVRKEQSAKVGVFVGVTTNTYLQRGAERREDGDVVIPTSLPWSIANRVSYLFNFHGPSLPVDTACSSSLTALHLACESLKQGECETAIAGGVNLYLHPSKYVSLSQMRMLSPTGRCHSFGAEGDGFVPGEGVGAVLLKPLSKAIADGDNIYGVIKGTAVNHGGFTSGYTVPNPNAQAELILETLRAAKLDPRTITYLEAHGTGTALGDPIEVTGLTKAYRTYTHDTQFCSIGSIKSNIGHLEAAAGIVGLTKILLQMKHGKIAPTLHVEQLNPNIEFAETPFFVTPTLSSWERILLEGAVIPRRAGLSSFGAGGANAHLIVEEYLAPTITQTSEKEEPHLFVLSAKDQDRLQAQVEQWLRFLEKASPEISLADISYTLQVGREAMEARLAVLVTSKEELQEALTHCRSEKGNEHATSLLIWRGMVASRKEAFVDRDKLRSWVEEGQWERVANAWVSGAEVDFAAWRRASGKRIPLPTYPFAKEHYEVKGSTSLFASRDALQTAKLHPVLDANESTLEEQCFRKAFSQDDFYVRDHVIGGQTVVPGAAHLEMAAIAGRLSMHLQSVHKLKNVIWSQPILPDVQKQDVFVALHPNGMAVDYEIRSGGEDGEPVIHSQGKLELTDAEANADLAVLDLEGIRKRCAVTTGPNAFYFGDQGAQYHYGLTMRPVVELHRGEREALARYELPSVLLDQFAEFLLHPTLIDGAFQTVSALLHDELASGTAYVPFALGELEICAPLTTSGFFYAEASDDSGMGQKLRKFHLTLTDEQGQVLVRIRDFATRAFQTTETVFYEWKWEPQKLFAPARKIDTLLFFAPSADMHEALLKQVGQKTYVVQAGTRFQEIDTRNYTIDPANPEDYKQLFRALAKQNALPTDIVHLWSSERFLENADTVQSQLEKSLYSVQFVCRALMEQRAESKVKEKVRLVYAYQTQDGELQPAYAAMYGFVNTLAMEQPNFLCSTLELPLLQANEDNRWAAEVLVQELTMVPVLERAVRYPHRNGARQVKRLQVWQPDHEVSLPKTLRERGVYVITGGAGGLGLLFAKSLATHASARLVLVGRSDLTEGQQEKIRELESFGAEVLYVKADVSKREDALRLGRVAKERFGHLNGVIHAAGLIRDSFVLKKNREEMAAVLAPKVSGTLFLDDAFKDEPLDFFVLFSSGAVVGNIGQSDYAYANSFMDHFSLWRKQAKRPGKTLSLNWPLWKDGGMQISPDNIAELRRSRGVVPLSTTAGLTAFAAGLGSDLPQLMVLEGEASHIKRVFGEEDSIQEVQEPLEQTDVPIAEHEESVPASVANETLLEKTVSFLKGILSKHTKHAIHKIQSEEALEKYGIDSVMIMGLTKTLEGHFGELSKTLFFEYQNIAELAEYFLAEHRDTLTNLFGQTVKSVAAKPKPIEKEPQKPRTKNRERFVQSAPAISTRSHLHRTEGIAIIGVSGRYPMANNLNEFWENLKQGRDCITEIPADRWDYRPHYDPKGSKGKVNSKWGGFLEDVDKFDPLFFNISPKEAEVMDPQERLFLETVWHTMEDAGYTRGRLDAAKVGVFVGVMYGHYQLFGVEESMKGNPIALSSSYASIANRVSYVFNFHGPSIALDTMCSSSLTAIHLACDSLYKGESELAVAGGVNVSIHPNKYTHLGQGKYTSSDGRCRSFGEGGDGYVPGEGVGAVLLKPLQQAIADGDTIYAVIKATTVNHGGKTNGYTVPNPKVQGELILEALKQADINPRTLSYIEAHGTGTSLGDPIEITGLMRAFGEYTKDKQFCSIGSAKSNIGHLESAAGIAGITKVLLQMKHGQLVPSLHAEHLNPNIPFEQSSFSVQQELAEWKRPLFIEKGREVEVPRRAGVSSFGAGGSNAHIILEEYRPVNMNESAIEESDEPQLILLSARTEERLKAYAREFVQFLQEFDTIGEDRLSTEERSLEMEAHHKRVEDEVLQITAELLNISQDTLDLQEALAEYGFDRVKLALLSERLDVPMTLFSEQDSLQTIAYELAKRSDRKLQKRSTLSTSPTKSAPLPFRLSDLAYTLQIGREAMEERLALLVSSKEELLEKLKQYLQNQTEIEDVYRGQIRSHRDRVELLIEGREGQEFFKVILHDRKWSKLAQLWVSGVEIDWRILYENQTYVPKRISLPVYPFARERYWVPQAPQVTHPNHYIQKGTIRKLHPLLDENVSTLREQKFQSKLQGTEAFLIDHVIDGHKVLPGAVLLEMVRAAGAIACEAPVTSIRNTAWGQPIVVADREVVVQISLYPNGDLVEFEVTTRGAMDQKNVHASGQLDVQQLERVQTIDIEAIRERCSLTVDGETVYQTFSEHSFTYGTSFQTIQRLHANREEALALLEVPATLRAEFGEYDLHPSLIDGALQSVIGILLASGKSFEALPFALGALEQHLPLTDVCYAYATELGGEGKIQKYAIALADKSGQVLVRLQEFTVRSATGFSQNGESETRWIEWLRKLESGEMTAEEVELLTEGIL